MSIDFFLSRSKHKDKDYLKFNNTYKGRIPQKFIAICQANEIDYLCISPKSKIDLWSRFKNDLYFDPASTNQYTSQDKNLLLIANYFSEFLGMIKSYPPIDIAGNDLDDDDPNIPFEDEDISDDFTHPEFFFKQSQAAIEIQLKNYGCQKRG